MGRLIIGDLSPVTNVDPKATPHVPKGASGAIDKWSKMLKFGNDVVSSNLGKGLMDIAGGAASDVAGRFGDLSAVLDAGKASDLTRAAQEATGDFSGSPVPTTPTAPGIPGLPAPVARTTTDSPPEKMMPGGDTQRAMQELESKLGKEYTALSETATSSPDPRVVSAADKRMKAIEAQLDAMKVKSVPDEYPDQNEAFYRAMGRRRRLDDGYTPAVGELESGGRPPAGSREMADAMARGMSSYTPKVAADDEQTALEMEMADSQLRRGGSIDQILGRRPDTKDKRVEGGMSPAQAYDSAIRVYTKMLDDAVARGDMKEMYRLSGVIQKMQDKMGEAVMAAPGTPQDFAQQKALRGRLQGLDPAAYGEPEVTPPTGPSGGFGPTLPGMSVQSVSNKPGGEEGVYYPKDFDGKMPTSPAKAPASPATAPGAPVAPKDAFDAAYAKFEEREPVVTQDTRHPMQPYSVDRAEVPTSEDIQSLAAMADTPEKQGKVLALVGKRPFKPSSIFDFTGGGETARFTEGVRKLFPKTTKMTDYQAATLADKEANREAQSTARAATLKRMNEQLAWQQRKWDEWKKLRMAELKAAKKKGGRGGDPLAGAKAADKALGEVEKGAAEEVEKIEKENSEAEKEAKKLEQEASRAEAKAGIEPGKSLPPPPVYKGSENNVDAKKEHNKELEKYEERKREAAAAKVVRDQATQARKDANDKKNASGARYVDAKSTHESAKKKRAENRKNLTGGK